ncbi:aldose epimerase family protein [Flagellimonas sp.]|uniref:aldose epimerase family protein n=1 Tax=Flagellimonas sp. TaxID=2058762 RepID=UPI003B50337C
MKTPFGTTKDGKKITHYKLTNQSGMSVDIINYGGIISSMEVPDKNGVFGDVVLGHDNIKDYEEKSDYFGCIVGRFGNRIAHGKFSLDSTEYKLFLNNNGHTLHGGQKGFDKQVWEAKSFENEDTLGVKLSYTSIDGEEGYPGNLKCEVTYTLTKDNALQIDYMAVTDKTTVINLTNHTYFNLKDGGNSSILDHQLQIDASHYTPVDEGLIPTGEIIPVAETPFDFRQPKPIGKNIAVDHVQLNYGLGYDHNYVLDKTDNALEPISKVIEPESGRILEVLTTEPGIQFYSGNFLKGNITGKHGITYQHRTGFCLETQHFPDSPNQPHFPSTVLKPGETYQSTTIYRFKVQD